MDAEKVFRLWRRVLRDPDYGDALLAPDGGERIAGLDADEQVIAQALYEHREAAYWPREGYRYRVISGARGALLAHAPLSARLLTAHGVDLRELASRFAATTGWRDDGPYAYRTCLDFLAYLETSDAALPELAELRDAVALDAATCQLLRRVATLPPEQRQAAAPAGALRAGQLYQRSPATTSVVVAHTATAWLEQPDAIGKVPLARETQRVIVQFTSTEAAPEYMAVGPNTHAVYQALERPRSLDQVAAALGQGADAAHATMRSLLEMDIIRPVAG